MAVSVSIDRENVIRKQAVGIIRVVPVMLEATGAFIEPIKAAASAADPEIARCIFVNAINVSAFTERIRVAGLRNVVGDLACLRIQSIQSAREEAYPQNAIGLLIDRLDPSRVRDYWGRPGRWP